MNKLSKTISIALIAIFSAGIFFISSVFAQNNLVVEYWTGTEWKILSGPIFNEGNFAPGNSVLRQIRVTNNSGSSQNIATEAINYPGFPNPENVPQFDLSRALTIVIREKDGDDLYGGSTGSKTLYDFYRKYGFNANSEHVLTYDLPSGQSKIYEFLISFPEDKGNEWQNASTSFDLLIGFQGKEGVVGGGIFGGGIALPPALTILEESVRITTTTETSVTVTWITSYRSTSQVIFARYDEAHTLNLSDNVGNPPKYGYARTTPEYDTPALINGVTFHQVTITGLEPATTYYFRCVSHGSLAISREYVFTTRGVRGVEEKEILPPGGEIVFIPKEEVPSKEEIPSEEIIPIEEKVLPKEKEEIFEKIPPENLGDLLLASLATIRNTPWMIFLIILSLLGIVFIGIKERQRRQKEKNK